MTNRDHLIDGLHSVLEDLWQGSDQAAESEFRKLVGWRARAVKPSVPTYRAGTFPAPALRAAEDLGVLEFAAPGMARIEAALIAGDKSVAAQQVKNLLSSLSERQAR